MNKRLFISIDLPDTVKDRLVSISCGLPGARWIDPAQFHLTLRFIGEVDGSAFLDIREALTAVSMESFALRLSGIGFFPPRKKPTVIWVGLEASEQLMQLHRRVNSVLREVGLEAEGRKFAPHITLARLKNTPTNRVVGFLEHHGQYYSEPFKVDRFILYSSILSSKGARHTPEEDYLLSGDL